MFKRSRSFCLFLVLIVMGSCGAYHQSGHVPSRLPASVASLDLQDLHQKLNQIYLHQVILEKHLRDESNLKTLRVRAASNRKRQLEAELVKQYSNLKTLQDELQIFASQSSLHAHAVSSLLSGSAKVTKTADLEQALVTLRQQREFQVAEKNIEHLAYMLE